MAYSSASKLYQGSVAPTLGNTTDYIEQSVLNPESLMRNKQEQYLYNLRNNQQMAQRGLIDPRSVEAKSYLDAGQADTIQGADLMDVYNRQRWSDPNLQERVTLQSVGITLPKTDTQKYVGKNGAIYEKSTTELPITEEGKAATGAPVLKYKTGEKTSTAMINPPPEKPKDDSGDKTGIEIGSTPDTTTELEDKAAIADKVKNYVLSMYGDNSTAYTQTMDAINKVIEGSVGERFKARMEELSDEERNSPTAVQGLIDEYVAAVSHNVGLPNSEIINMLTRELINYENSKQQYVVQSKSGIDSEDVRSMSLIKTGNTLPIKYWNPKNVKGVDIDPVELKDPKTGEKFYMLSNSKGGKTVVPLQDVAGLQERMKRNFEASKNQDNPYLVDLDDRNQIVSSDMDVQLYNAFGGNMDKMINRYTSKDTGRVEEELTAYGSDMLKQLENSNIPGYKEATELDNDYVRTLIDTEEEELLRNKKSPTHEKYRQFSDARNKAARFVYDNLKSNGKTVIWDPTEMRPVLFDKRFGYIKDAQSAPRGKAESAELSGRLAGDSNANRLLITTKGNMESLPVTYGLQNGKLIAITKPRGKESRIIIPDGIPERMIPSYVAGEVDKLILPTGGDAEPVTKYNKLYYKKGK